MYVCMCVCVRKKNGCLREQLCSHKRCHHCTSWINEWAALDKAWAWTTKEKDPIVVIVAAFFKPSETCFPSPLRGGWILLRFQVWHLSDPSWNASIQKGPGQSESFEEKETGATATASCLVQHSNTLRLSWGGDAHQVFPLAQTEGVAPSPAGYTCTN